MALTSLCIITNSISTSDWVDIVSILVNSIIGIWIGYTVQVNLTKNRALKDYFIEEIKTINGSYSTFLSCLYKGVSNSKDVKDWFKVMTIKIEAFENSLKSELCINTNLLVQHNKLKQYLTEVDEFNDHYKKPHLTLSALTKSTLLDEHKNLKNIIIKIIIDINKAKHR